MNKLICFRHPKYEPEKSPDLSCKVCCDAFVERVKNESDKKLTSVSQPHHQKDLPATKEG